MIWYFLAQYLLLIINKLYWNYNITGCYVSVPPRQGSCSVLEFNHFFANRPQFHHDLLGDPPPPNLAGVVGCERGLWEEKVFHFPLRTFHMIREEGLCFAKWLLYFANFKVISLKVFCHFFFHKYHQFFNFLKNFLGDPTRYFGNPSFEYQGCI